MVGKDRRGTTVGQRRWVRVTGVETQAHVLAETKQWVCILSSILGRYPL